jgi:hypothetical protein
MPNEMEEHEARFVPRPLPTVPAHVAEAMRQQRMAQYQMRDTLDEHGNPIPLYDQAPVIQGDGGRPGQAWFRYEGSQAGAWVPVVIYGRKPTHDQREGYRITGAEAVPPEGLAADGSPMFGKLQALFPPPEKPAVDPGS